MFQEDANQIHQLATGGLAQFNQNGRFLLFTDSQQN